MPWIKEEKLYPIIALLLILIMAVRTPLDTDMWWHLRSGEQTWINQEVYRIDTFSFTRVGTNWINHSWLSQVLMYLIYNGGGYFGISIWVGLSAALSMFFLYLQLKGHPLLRSSVLILAGVVSSVVWSPRPQINSLILFALLYFLINQFKTKGKARYLFGVPLIFILWANLHGGYVLGFILIGSVIGGELVNKVLLIDRPESFTWRQLGTLGIILLSSVIAVLFNPFGVEMWLIPFNTVGVESLQNLISEWASPDFHQAFQQPMLWLMLGVFALIGLSKKGIDGTDLLPLMVFSFAALVARRNFGPFAIVAAPVFAEYLGYLIDEWLDKASVRFKWVKTGLEQASNNNQELKPAIKNLVNSILIIALLGGVSWKIFSANNQNFIDQAEKEIYPLEAVALLKESAAEGNILNEYNWGGYLIWHLREYPVFVDGRTDLFGDEIIDQWSDLLSGKGPIQDQIDHWEVDYVLVRPDRQIISTLPETWKILLSTDSAVLMGKSDEYVE